MMSESLRGHILIAACHLRDSNFFKTAVLVVEDSEEGAMGLVINRPSSITITKALCKHIDLPENQGLIYMGGPVEPAALFVVHNSPELEPEEACVSPGIYMGSSAEVFEDIVCNCEGGDGLLQYRVFCGCAGWGPGQLQGELERGDWLIIPAQAGYVFHSNPYEVWDELLASSFRSRRILTEHCEHPEWN